MCSRRLSCQEGRESQTIAVAFAFREQRASSQPVVSSGSSSDDSYNIIRVQRRAQEAQPSQKNSSYAPQQGKEEQHLGLCATAEVEPRRDFAAELLWGFGNDVKQQIKRDRRGECGYDIGDGMERRQRRDSEHPPPLSLHVYVARTLHPMYLRRKE